jgi:hypothetical protein
MAVGRICRGIAESAPVRPIIRQAYSCKVDEQVCVYATSLLCEQIKCTENEEVI